MDCILSNRSGSMSFSFYVLRYWRYIDISGIYRSCLFKKIADTNTNYTFVSPERPCCLCLLFLSGPSTKRRLLWVTAKYIKLSD